MFYPSARFDVRNAFDGSIVFDIGGWPVQLSWSSVCSLCWSLQLGLLDSLTWQKCGLSLPRNKLSQQLFRHRRM